MSNKRIPTVFFFIAAALSISAGLRNFFMPGFLSMSSRHDTNGTVELVAGGLLFLLGLFSWKRWWQ